MTAPPDPDRPAELVGALAAVRSRIRAACAAAGRDPREITMIAVTKGFPAADIVTLGALGIVDFGESRDQEVRGKLRELADWPPAQRRWHVVGRLQTNKARSVVSYATGVHSVDRPELATALADAARKQDRPDPLDVFVQISLDDDPERGGALPGKVAEVAALVAADPQLRLRGVMAVAPLSADPDDAFARLGRLAAALRVDHPTADAISAGMSGDLESAVRHGATHLRIGSALLGRREPNFG